MTPQERAEKLCIEAEKLGLDGPTEDMIAIAIADAEYCVNPKFHTQDWEDSEECAKCRRFYMACTCEEQVNPSIHDHPECISCGSTLQKRSEYHCLNQYCN